MKGLILKDVKRTPFFSPPASTIDQNPFKGSPLREALGLLKRAVTTSNDVTARALYDDAYRLLDDLEVDRLSAEGALVRKHRPGIRKSMNDLKRNRASVRALIRFAEGFWNRVSEEME